MMEPMVVPMLAGASAGVVARIACHPIDTIKSKLQVAFERARLLARHASVHVRLPSGPLTVTSAPSPLRLVAGGGCCRPCTLDICRTTHAAERGRCRPLPRYRRCSNRQLSSRLPLLHDVRDAKGATAAFAPTRAHGRVRRGSCGVRAVRAHRRCEGAAAGTGHDAGRGAIHWESRCMPRNLAL